MNNRHLNFVNTDKYNKDIETIFSNFRYSEEPTEEKFLFKNTAAGSMKDGCTDGIYEVHHRDLRTKMTPLNSSTTSRCHTPFKSSSPARYNTPTNRLGPLPLVNSSSTIDVAQLQECHFGKL